MPFDIQEYYNKHKDYYGDVPLDAVAKDIYDRGYSDKFGDFGEFKKAAGIHDTILADSNRRKGPSSVSPLGLGKSFVKGAAEGLTTELPSMVGKSLQFVGPSGGKIEHAGKSIADWAEEKREAWYGPEEERSGLDRIVYEGAKMFAPSVIPGGIAGTAARGALRVGSIAAKAKTAADVAQKTALMAEATRKAGIAVNIGSGAAAGLFGLSQAQETRDTALERADQLEAEGKTKEAQEMRKKAYGVAPLATGAVEALGEFLGTKYLAKLFRLDESVIAKMGTKEFAINLLKTMGVEVGTEIGQEGSQAFIEKHTGIRPEANPLQEAMDVIGPTVFLTLLTGGLAGAANKMRSDDKSEREGAQELERLKQGAVLTMTIHDGLKTGQHQGRPFTADDASKLMKMGQAAGFYTKDDIERFHEQYPVLKPAANELLVEDVKKKVTEALFNEKGQPLLPPGQGFTFRDVDYGIPVGEPYGGEDILRPTITRAPEEAIDAEFETIRQLPAVRRDETLALPPGQGFTLIETPPAKEVDYQAEAEKYGVKYNGIQKGHKDIPDMPMFTADIDGVQTTFVLNQGETLPQAIERKRLQKEEYDARETKKGPIDVESGASPVAEVPVGQIKISKDVKQFKEGADEAGIVAGQEIKGEEYRRTPYNPIVLWRRNNGDLEVVTGRHRLEFAKRIGEETIPAQILNESDGFTAQDALTFDAEQNILDNQGTERDYANYFRNTEIDEGTARERGLLRGKKEASAFLLGKAATDQTFNAFYRHKDIGFKQAVAIARAAPGDERLQLAGRSYVAKNPRATEIETENFVRAISLAKESPKQEQGDLFGFDDSAIRTAEIQSKKASAVINRLRRDLSNINAAIRGEGKLILSKEGAKEYGIKNPKDKEQLKAAIAKIQNEVGKWEKWYVNPELVKQLTETPDTEATEKPAEAKTEPKPEPAVPPKKQAIIVPHPSGNGFAVSVGSGRWVSGGNGPLGGGSIGRWNTVEDAKQGANHLKTDKWDITVSPEAEKKPTSSQSGIVTRVDNAINQRDRSNILIEIGQQEFPEIRLQEAEEAGQWAYSVAKGDATQQQFDDWKDQMRREGRAKKAAATKPQSKEDPHTAAVGVISGGTADRIKGSKYEFAYGETKPKSDTYYDMVGMFSGGKADRLIAAGITIKKKASTEAKLTYEQFAAAYRQAWDNSNKYTLDEVGHGIYVDEMAKLADENPEHLERFEAEEEARAKAPKRGRTAIGQNEKGNKIYEDENGVRSIVESGVQITESVEVVPTQGGLKTMVDASKRPRRFKTTEELAGETPAKQAETDLSGKSTQELVGDIFSIINNHVGSRGSISNRKIEVEESLYQKLKPYLIEIARRAKERALDMKAYLFGAVDAMPNSTAKKVYEAAAERYIEEEAGEKGEPSATPYSQVADNVLRNLQSGIKFTRNDLFAMCDKAFNGTLAEGKYSAKDAYDALEMGVNKYIMESAPPISASSQEAKGIVTDLKGVIDLLPTQSTRTEEMDEWQQFSTPPPLAYVANWVANLNVNDTYLEPSAGTGGLATFAKVAGVKTVIVNELAPRRATILKKLGFDQVFTENAEQLNNILPKDVQPTVVVMNPPFSATAGRMKGQRKTINATSHIEQALKRLQPGGRLVAIVGKGMAADKPAFRSWWDNIRKDFTVRANVGISGMEYAKYGTTFDNQIIVIDKPLDQSKKEDIIELREDVNKVENLIDLLAGVRNDRTDTRKQKSAEQGKQEGVVGPEAGTGRGDTLQRPVGGVVTESQPGRPGREADADRGRDEVLGAGERGEVSGAKPRDKGAGRPGDVATGTKQSAGTGRPDRSSDTRQDSGNVAAVPPDAVESLTIEQREAVEKRSDELTDSVYDTYRPAKVKIPNAKEHPGKLVESAAMASVEPIDPVYSPRIPERAVKSGKISIAQLEAVVYAGQAHSELLPDGSRKGFFIGDGTGVGKGREIAAILWDNWNQGRRKALWVSQNSPLMKDAERDISGVGWDPGLLFDLGKTKLQEPLKQKDGVGFVGYGTMRSKKIVNGKEVSRQDQLLEWLGNDFDGCIIFDESHNMGNALPVKGKRGTTKPSATALTGVELQRLLPKARIVYVSATGATEVMNLAYAERLGLWGDKTPFPTASNFVASISSGGITAMELVAMNMKANGVYTARSLAYDDVKYERLEHSLTDDQRQIYDELAGAWQIAQRDIAAALTVTGVTGVDASGGQITLNKDAKAHIMAQFWGTNQRFWNQVITAMQMPSVIRSIEKDLKDGRAPLVQLINTNEAAQQRAIGRMEEEDSLEELDITPKDMLIEYVNNSFPVYQFETYTDDQGNERSRIARDSNGDPVLNAEAVEMRDNLLMKIAAIRVPDGPLEMILDHFGVDQVAEVTGRSRRVVYKDTAEGRNRVVEPWGKQKGMADADAFMADKKKVLVFSQAGGTGRSYHADRTAKNTRLRRHYLVQAGWRADIAVQGLGRSHRTNQEQAPEWVLVTTDLEGQRRFISSIARRLSQLGALTKGSRETGNQGLFNARDNLESTEAIDAFHQLLEDLHQDNVSDITMGEFIESTGLDKIIDQDTGALNVSQLPTITQFLNRILNMKIEMQNKVFGEFLKRLNVKVAMAIEKGTLDVGVETIRAKKTEKVNEQDVYSDDKTKAKATYIEVELTHDAKLLTFNQSQTHNQYGYVQNIKSGRIWALAHRRDKTDSVTGGISRQYTAIGANYNYHTITEEDVNNSEKYNKLSNQEAAPLWDADYEAAPKEIKERVHMITGAILPIWDRLPTGMARIYRLQVDGKNIIGRVIGKKHLDETLRKLGAQRKAGQFKTDDVFANVLSRGYRYELSNGWNIQRRKVADDFRIEIKGPNYYNLEELRKYGVFTERIGYETRYFIPTEKDAGVRAINEIISSRPIVDEIAAGKKSGDVTAQDAAFINETGQYAIGAETKVADISLADVQAVFRGQKVIKTKEGFLVFTKAGNVLVKSVNRIDANTYALTIGYGKERLTEGHVIAGRYQSGVITLTRGAAGRFTLAHESVHFMEDIGVIDGSEVKLLRNHIKNLVETGKFKTLNSEDIGGAEDRAEFLAGKLTQEPKGLLGRIVRNIQDFIDRIVNALGIRTVGGVIRDIKTGAIFGSKIDNRAEAAYNYVHEEVSDRERETLRGDTRGQAGVQYHPTVVGRENIGSVKSSRRTIRRPQDAAQIASRYLKKYPDEHLISMVMDKDGSLLHVYRHTVGLPGYTQVSISIIAGEALNTPGAANIIVAHNHPSQRAELSAEDKAFTKSLEDTLRGSGVELADSLAVTSDSYSSHKETGGDLQASLSGAAAGKVNIPILGRVFETIHNGPKISNPESAKAQAETFIPSGGILVVDGQNAIAGTVDISDFNKIRGNVQAELLKALEQRNGRNMIVYAPNRAIKPKEADNLSRFLRAARNEVKLLDIIDTTGSWADQGNLPLASVGGVDFYSVGTGPETTPKPVGGNEVIIKKYPSLAYNDVVIIDDATRGLKNKLPAYNAEILSSKEIAGDIDYSIEEIHYIDPKGIKKYAYVRRRDALEDVYEDSVISLKKISLTDIDNVFDEARKSYEQVHGIPEWTPEIQKELDKKINNNSAIDVADDLQKLKQSLEKQITDLPNPSRPPEVGEQYSLRHQTFNDLNMADTFYSKLIKTVTDKIKEMPSKIQSIPKWLGRQNVKPAEMKWMGVEQWLAENQKDGRIDKQKFADFLKENQIEIKEVTKGGNLGNILKRSEIRPNIENGETVYGYNDGTEEWDTVSTVKEANQYSEFSLTKPTAGTKFHAYQLPGGENYRELLLMLPPPKRTIPSYEEWVGLEKMKQEDASVWDFAGDVKAEVDFSRARYEREKVPLHSEEAYRSSHWDEPNVLAHVRMNDRVDADGNKILFLEEVQSDWHQEGKKKGYADDSIHGFKSYLKNLESQNRLPFQYSNEIAERIFRDTTAPLWKSYKAEGVPAAPFAENWHELLMKRMLRYAAENGYDKIAWTTGEIQAERYDLSKYIDRIEYEPAFVKGGSGKEMPSLYEFVAYGKDGKEIIHEDEIDLKRIEEIAGKEIAEKIRDDVGESMSKERPYRDWRKLSGLDLKVGGEGMKSFYDNLIPGFMNKYVKQWGAKVGLIDITAEGVNEYGESIDESVTPSREVSAHSVDITPAMKQDVLFKGQEYYSIRDSKAPPTTRDPKVVNEYIKDEADAIFQTIMNKLKPKSMTWLETMLKTPEWFDHPQINNIVRLFVRDRNEIYHQTFNDLNMADDIDATESTITEAGKALKGKGLSLVDRLAGKESAEYKMLSDFLDYFDTEAKRDPNKSDAENLADCEAYMRKNGATDDVVRVWRLYRQSYDKALDLQTRQLREMIDKVVEEATFRGESPEASLAELKSTLKYALAEMEKWRGYYAPRIREAGDWKVQAYKEHGPLEANREYYREHRASELSAQRLAKKLARDGWKITSIGRVEKLPESVYQDVKAVAATKLIDKALERVEAHDTSLVGLNAEILRAVADEIKARGFRSHMIHRKGGAVIKGYIEDPLTRHLLYINQLSGGISKSVVAQRAMKELLGEKIMGKQVGGIDPVADPRAYAVATNYIQEQLRNMDATDRVIGLAKSVATFKFLGFNLRSLTVNMTALLTTTPTSIHQYATGGKGNMTTILKSLVSAGKDFGSFMAGRKLASAEEQAFLEEIHKKGWDDAQYTRDALGTIQRTHSRAWSDAMSASMYLFGVSEKFNRGTTLLAAYRMARKQGHSAEEAAEMAKTASDNAHGTYGRATLPMWAQGPNPAAKIGQMLYVYAKFPHNYLQMLYDVGFKKHNVKGALFAFLSPIVLAGVAALPFKDVIFAFAGFLLRAIGDDERDPEKWVWDNVRKHLGEGAERAGRHGITGALGVDLSGSLSIGVGVPKGLMDLTGAIGGVIEDVGAFGQGIATKQYSKAAEAILPTGIGNPLRAYRESREGVSTRDNRPVWDESGRQFVPTGREAVAKSLGFRSTRQAVLSERTWEGRRQRNAFNEKRSQIYRKYRAWMLSGKDRERYKEIVKEVQEYNRNLHRLGLVREIAPITSQSLKAQARLMQAPTKRDRAMLENNY